MEIFPSLISGDILHIADMLKRLDPHVDGYHIDVMDDHFVPNLTWGASFVNAISSATVKKIHVHLMVKDPFQWLDRLTLKRNDCFIFHYESISHKEVIPSLIKEVSGRKWHCGIALSPQTNAREVSSFLSMIDQVLIMSVNPGFSGQSFIREVTQKIPFFIQEKEQNNYSFRLAIDGGIGADNIVDLYRLGVEQFAIATAIFGQGDPIAAINALYNQIATL